MKQFSKSKKFLTVVLVCVFILSIFTLSGSAINQDSQGAAKVLNTKLQKLDTTYIFPNSHKVKITEENIMLLEPEKLDLARNEIFARRGHIFKLSKYKNYFSKKSWYKPLKDVKVSDLNQIEKYNVNLIKLFEDKNKNTGTIHASSNGIIVKENKKVSYDMNGDGKKETILYNRSESEYELTINNMSIQVQYGNPADSIAIVDIDKKDKYKEIMVSDYGPSDDYTSTYYYFDGKKIVKMGTTGGLFDYGVSIKGSGKFSAMARGQILQTWFFDKQYQLSKTRKIELIPQSLYKTDFKVFLKHKLKLYSNKTNKNNYFTLAEGQIVNIVGTDDKRWCMIESETGKRGYMEIEKFYFVKNESLNATEIFAGLCFAD